MSVTEQPDLSDSDLDQIRRTGVINHARGVKMVVCTCDRQPPSDKPCAAHPNGRGHLGINIDPTVAPGCVLTQSDDRPLVIRGEDGRELFAINKDGSVTGIASDASEAARLFCAQVQLMGESLGLFRPAA